MVNQFRPVLNRLRRMTGKDADFWDLADEVWHPASAEVRAFPAALALPGQLDRISATVFGDEHDTRRALTEGGPRKVGPTVAARFRDVDLVDGVLYKARAEFHLRPRQSRWPLAKRPAQTMSGALYDSWIGLRYFGNWLMDNTETYRLAEADGVPLTIRGDSAGHRADYERLLGIAPQRAVGDVHFDELILYQDLANNSGKLARAADRRSRLAAGRNVSSTPGVFLLRGRTGDLRLLENEAELADSLFRRHGIVPLQAEDQTVDALLSTCAGARVVIGVEGSQLTHALTVMPPGGAMLALFPPDRATAAMKLMTDRLELSFAFVVGLGSIGGFRVDPDELEATLQLLS
jgi:Glycosyltransferase 61